MTHCPQDSTEVKGNSFLCTDKNIYDTAYARCDLPQAYGYDDYNTCMKEETQNATNYYCIKY